MSKIIIVVESGSDISEELRKEYGIYVVPMHVTFGSRTKDDGSFPPHEVCDYYDSTGDIPKTSGCTPNDYIKVFDDIRSKHPDAGILLLGYSAVTTCSFQSALLIKDKYAPIECVDTKSVTIGQCAVAIKTAKIIRQHPEWSLKQAAEAAKCIAQQTKFIFIVDDLKYLKAGGRCRSSTAFIGGLLHIHPVIEIEDGYLRSNIKLRGSIKHLLPKVFSLFMEKYSPDMEEIWIGGTAYISQEIKRRAEELAKDWGFKNIIWTDTGSVITTHGGPNAFGIAGYCKSK